MMIKRYKRYGLLIQFCLVSLLSNAQTITNPVLAGFYPDPAICRAGNDYYLVNSSFAYYPGLPIFHSRDLLNWTLIGHAMNRPEQLNLDGAGVSRGLFAPGITYHNGLFYIICTEVSKLGNFVITAKDPAGPWSNPVKIPELNGIDPSIFFDEDGKSYIVYNSIPPENITKWNGHRTIRMFEFDAASLKVTGTEKLLINGGTDTSRHPVWIEGPHLYKKDGWYYLMCAEGGTGYNHSEVIFRSRSVQGPFVSFEQNPILTQRHLDPARPNPVSTTGHADLVQAPDGKWWGVFLGCRPYEGDYYNTGRETFMAPVSWQDGWPRFELGGEAVRYQYPIEASKETATEAWNGNYVFRDEFDQSVLSQRYCFLRTVRESWYDLISNPGEIRVRLRPETCNGNGNPSFIGFRQSHLRGHTTTALKFEAGAANEKAGLLLFQNEKHYYHLCISQFEGKPVIELYQGDSLLVRQQLQKNPGQTVYLQARADMPYYTFWYATKKNRWKQVAGKLDAKYLSTKTAGGFVGTMYALYATSTGQPSANTARYEWFESVNEDTVYQ